MKLVSWNVAGFRACLKKGFEDFFYTCDADIYCLQEVKAELNKIDFENNKVILLTAHRRENWGEPMKNIFAAVREVAEQNDDVQIIFPMHKNPLIRDLARESFKGIEHKVALIEPLEYVDFANLMNKYI